MSNNNNKRLLSGVFQAAYFRAAKAYRLEQKREGEDVKTLERCRGIARRHVAKLKNVHFGQDVKTNAAVVAGVEMKGTLGLQVVMQIQGRVS